MLYFIGLGLYDERDISVKGLEAVRAADTIYAEFYTSRLMGTSPEKLEALYGKSIHLLSREEVEVDPAWLEEAREKDVAFLVGGDAMVSTTHLDLRLRAAEMGIDTRVIHCQLHRHCGIRPVRPAELPFRQIYYHSLPLYLQGQAHHPRDAIPGLIGEPGPEFTYHALPGYSKQTC